MSKFITQINTSEDIYTMYSLESFYFDICNEGFGDTIKSGIDSMCKYLKNFFKYIADLAKKLYNKAKSLFKKKEKDEEESSENNINNDDQSNDDNMFQVSYIDKDTIDEVTKICMESLNYLSNNFIKKLETKLNSISSSEDFLLYEKEVTSLYRTFLNDPFGSFNEYKSDLSDRLVELLLSKSRMFDITNKKDTDFLLDLLKEYEKSSKDISDKIDKFSNNAKAIQEKEIELEKSYNDSSYKNGTEHMTAEIIKVILTQSKRIADKFIYYIKAISLVLN